MNVIALSIINNICMNCLLPLINMVINLEYYELMFHKNC